MRKLIVILISILTVILFSCNGNGDNADAYGNFEATEIIISSETNGKLLFMDAENGRNLKKGELIGQIDTTILQFKLKQLKAAREEIFAGNKDVLAQINVLKEQKSILSIEQKRIENLMTDSAATAKQYDDILGKIRIIDKQIESVKVKNATILSKSEQLEAQIEELKEMINKCKIINPINATVLQKYAEPFEIVMTGRPLYKIADLSSLELKVYVNGSQLSKIKIGQKAKIYIDKTDDENTELEGTITWISSSAEFTPKIIQTKEERVKLVYAVKIIVKNDGSLKIGMPGEVVFN
ncbi:MAG: HlyD family efflux transporter periplasmic adaptor subunit [Bacteroidales bacterium]|nr:HlyD family efflux transporter periplasmic adaptor subunit [Bacteroidales bacterium]MBN2758260.1 HlyD family efflux transporter periplasmic adaptor subunit [Bacteroidales bacterium]